MIRRRLWVSVIAVLLAGCSTSTSTSAPKSASGWVRSDLRPVTQPESAGGRLVLYVEAGEGLQVVSLDPKTGRTVWQDAASPGRTTSGVFPALGVVGSTVTFLRPVDDSTGSAEVVGVDAATGRQLWHTPAGAFRDWPTPCPDNPLDVCTTGTLGQSRQAMALSFRASDGTPDGATTISQSLARSLSEDLLDPGTRNPDMLVALSGTSVAWTRTLASVFPYPGMSSDNGWAFDRIPAAGLFVGSVADSATNPGVPPFMTAGFRISDGTTVWRDANSLYACGQPLPCPGGNRIFEAGLAYRPPTEGLRLRLSAGPDVAIEGFDLATGKTTWSYDAGTDDSLFDQAPPLIGPYEVSVPTPAGGSVALDLTTGATSPIGADALLWCQEPSTYTMKVGYPNSEGRLVTAHNGQPTIRPCTSSASFDVPPPATVPSFVGTVVDGLTVWGEPSEVIAALTR